MCEICGGVFCPESCPGYRGYSPEGGLPIGKCSVCEEYVSGEERYYLFFGRLLCEKCRGMAVDRIKRIEIGRANGVYEKKEGIDGGKDTV